MALRRRNWREDVRWLRWPLSLLAVVIVASISLYISASIFRNDMQRQEFNALSDLDLLNGQVDEIEQAEQVIVNNIGLYNSMVANGIMAEEDRVNMLEAITQIRERYYLFPINVSIGEQDRLLLEYPESVAFPDDQITLRNSQVQVRYSLLHEEDLTRFLRDYLAMGDLVVPSLCNVSAALEDPADRFNVVQHQIADCQFQWYTFQREPYLGF
ncbi:MAG: hypothetical protein MI746_00785 [Pseudomonadales bacterium]|nr:hypothetical protein [Pseudomonadales bacterium]